MKHTGSVNGKSSQNEINFKRSAESSEYALWKQRAHKCSGALSTKGKTTIKLEKVGSPSLGIQTAHAWRCSQDFWHLFQECFKPFSDVQLPAWSVGGSLCRHLDISRWCSSQDCSETWITGLFYTSADFSKMLCKKRYVLTSGKLNFMRIVQSAWISGFEKMLAKIHWWSKWINVKGRNDRGGASSKNSAQMLRNN